MQKIVPVALLVLALCFSGCAAGPHQLMRTVDDLDQRTYVESPWMSGVLWVVPVFPALHFAASIGDFFIGDAYAFWAKDAWDGKGTGFRHYEVKHTDGSVSSLLIDDGKFMRVN